MDRLYIPVIILHLSIVAKNILLQRSHNYGVWNHWQQKLLYCICYTIGIDWHMIFGLEQEGGSLIAPMAHPLHPIDNRSRNRRRNLWVGLCVSSWWPLFPSGNSVLIDIYIYICIYKNTYLYTCIFYVSSVIGRIYTYNRSVIQYWWSCTPSHYIGLYLLGSAQFLPDDNSLIPGCLWLLVFVLNNTLILGIWCPTNSHLPGCLCPWTFFQNIGFKMVLSDPFLSYLATQLGYSACEFQALELVILAAFVVVD